MVLVSGGEVCTMPATTGISLVELAARQQRQIEAHQRELSAREQRLQSLKQQEAHLAQEHRKTQEQKLRQLRAQLDHQLSTNNNYSLELERVRTLFNEKEKELSAAAARVEDLTRQLEHIHQAAGWLSSSSTPLDLDKLRRELMYRQKLSEQQASRITQQKETFAKRKHELSIMDQKIADLQQRLHKKLLHNQQMTKQSAATKTLQAPDINCSQDDLHAKFTSSLDHFAPSKNDPKYQTLPYNTKFPPPKSDAASSTSYEVTTNSHNASTNTNNDENNKNDPLANESKLHSTKKENDVNSLSLSSEGFVPIISPPIYSSKGSIFKNNGTTFALKATLLKQPLPQQPTQTSSPQALPKSNKLHTLESKSSTPPPPPPPEKSLTKKPVVPPKPAKPLALRVGTAQSNTADTVDAALSVLKNSTIESTSSTALEGKPPPAKYPIRFGKKEQQSGKGSDTETTPTEDVPEPNIAMIDPPPRHGPIRAKPLTIKKHLGEQPPRLKATSLKRCPIPLSEPPQSRALPAAFLFPDKITTPPSATLLKPLQLPCTEVKPATSKEDDVINQLVADIEKATNDIALESPSEETVPAERTDGDGDSGASSSANACTPDEPSLDFLCRSLESNGKKGNLKSNSSATKRVRRVSFDPLALLLDAALEGELELVMKTAQEVPNPSAANDEGITALHNAICAGHLDIVTFLAEYGCDVNSQDSDGWTPLHCAASCNNLPMVKFLVEKGACIFAATLSDQETAAEKCEEDEEGFDGCSEFLYSIQEQLGVVNDGVVYAVFDYTAQNEDELSFKDGDKLTVLRRGDDTERLWWWCRHNATGAEGYVPRNLLGLFPRLSHQSTA